MAEAPWSVLQESICKGVLSNFQQLPKNCFVKCKEADPAVLQKTSAAHVDILYIVSISENIGAYLDRVIQMS